jgi:ABC-type nickel/cobalt efflux system permease component RcnA
MTMLFAALSVGFLHTLLGPDHYIPFIVIGRARKWGLGLTSLLTLACGLGHVLSSVVVGVVGVLAGAALHSVEGWESSRGEWAGWGMVIFGAGYMIWGIVRALRNKSHGHWHLHPKGDLHQHGHDHGNHEGHPAVHDHRHDSPDGQNQGPPQSWRSLTPWLLFIIFVLGPCEPLIPMFFAPAVAGTWHEVLVVSIGYGLATLVTMHALVTMFWFGLKKLPLGPLERWSNTIAGAIILLAGLSIVFLGL